MKIIRANSGRVISGNTPFGIWNLEISSDHNGPIFNADGKRIGELQFQIREPQSPSSVLSCIHRGAELRREQCPTCKGKVEVAVFACAVHKQCTIARKIDGAILCAMCADRK